MTQRHDRTADVSASAEELDDKTARMGNLAEFFYNSPLQGSKLLLQRTTEEWAMMEVMSEDRGRCVLNQLLQKLPSLQIDPENEQ
jgi:hypothetical protein